MPHPKLKSENYENLGGINRKLSQYLTPKTEFLDLQNVDFKTVGALSSFAGYTQFLTGATSPITGIAMRTSFGLSSPIQYQTFSIIATTGYNACDVSAGSFNNRYDYIWQNTNNPFDFVQANSLFGSNQWDFFNMQNGGSFYQYSLPKPFFNLGPVGTQVGTTGGLSGSLVLYWSFVRADNFYGPYIAASFSVTGCTGLIVRQPILNNDVRTTAGISTGSFGISGMQLWYSLNGSVPRGLSTLLGATQLAGLPSLMINDQFASFSMTSIQPEDYFGTFLYGFTAGNGATFIDPVPGPVNPQCIEHYNNQLFAAGFANAVDDVWYSQIGNLEKHDNDGFFKVGAGDGDYTTNLKSYLTQLNIWKSKSTWVLTGTDPDNFVLTLATDQYGCINNRAACAWEQRLWFLDKKGICEYNGANTKIISEKVEDYFLRMNLTAARTQAQMAHVKERNEVWCAIPIDGASLNNIIVIYDYVADCWTTRTDVAAISSIGLITRGFAKEEVFFGTSAGTIFNFGQSFFTDNASNFTSVIKSRFVNDMGNSIEKQFRRLFIDASIPSGSTYSMTVNFYRNQSTTPALTRTVALSDFQRRIDFGLSAKDLAVEFVYSGGEFLKLNGFTIEYRYQRSV